MAARETLRAVLYLGGAVATGAGLHTAVAGGRSVAGEGLANAALESEIRFYGVFYAAYGLGVLRLAPRADEDTAAVRAVAATVFLAGLARAGGWLAAGKPHPFQRFLLAVELGAPPAVIACHERLRAAERG